MRRKIFLPFISLFLFGFAVYHVVTANQIPPKPAPPIEPARNPFRDTIAGSGVVEPRSENIALGSHLPGIVSKVYVKVGDRVQKGDKLLELDDRQLRAELNVRKANLASAKSALEKQESYPRPEDVPAAEAKVREAKAVLASAQDTYRRSKMLIKSLAIGEEELISKLNSVRVAEAQLARFEADLALLNAGAWKQDKQVARAAMEQAAAMVEQTQMELNRLVVTAPIDGQILQKNVREGEYVGIPPTQALFVLGDLQTLHIRMDVDENDLPRFQSNYTGKATLRGDPTKSIRLRFVRVEPYLIPKRSLTGAGTERVDTRVLQVIYAVENPEMSLYIGQQVDVYLDKVIEKPTSSESFNGKKESSR